MNARLTIWTDVIPGYTTEYDQPAPSLAPYVVKGRTATGAVIICPGGGYQIKSDFEGEPVARWLNALGISAFVLDYRVAPYRHPYPLTDARRAIQLVRSRAESWNILPDRIGILGFSAGGHLAASAGTLQANYRWI